MKKLYLSERQLDRIVNRLVEVKLDLYHGTAKPLKGHFEIGRSNTVDAIFLTPRYEWAMEYAYGDEARPEGVVYAATVELGKHLDTTKLNKHQIDELRPIIKDLIEQNYTDEKTKAEFKTYAWSPTIRGKEISNPTLDDWVEWYMEMKVERGSWRIFESAPVYRYIKNIMGYDSMKIMERNQENYVIFDAKNIELKSYQNASGKVTKV